MTNDDFETGAGQPEQPATIQFAVSGLDYSAVKHDLTTDKAYLRWVMECIKAEIEVKNEVLGGHMVEEAEAAGAVLITRAPPAAAAYQNPQGERVNPNVPPSAPPSQQPPPAAPQQVQRGIPDGAGVPGEVHAVCGNTAVFKAPFTAKSGKQISGMLNCPVCKNDKGFQQLVRWLNDDDPAWVTING